MLFIILNLIGHGPWINLAWNRALTTESGLYPVVGGIRLYMMVMILNLVPKPKT